MNKKCFVIMPFSKTIDNHSKPPKEHSKEYWTEFFESFIKPAVVNLGYECTRSEAKPKNIIKGILEDLTDADIVLAILTDNNPNVWYELGTRHALKRGTVMVIEKGQSIPFDISQYGLITYVDNIAKHGQFQSDLGRYFKEIEQTVENDSPALDFYGERHFRPCWIADRVQETPLNIISRELLSRVRQQLIIVGQNLFTLTQERNGFKKMLFEQLQSRNIQVDLIVCENLDYICRATAEFTANEFGEHLSFAIKTFKQWEDEISSTNWPGTFTLHQSKKLGSLSLTFLDPNSDQGELLLTPIVQPHATGRTCFWMTKKAHKNTFNHYLSMYESMLAKY